MKTPEEIKKGLGACEMLDGDCENCPYDDGLQRWCVDRLRKDALAYIQQLEAGIDHAEKVARECAKSITENLDKLQAKLAQLESDNESKQERIEELDQMVTMASRQLSLDLGRLEYYADEKKRTDETLSYAHGEMMKLRVELSEAKSRLAQVERERDAAVADINVDCTTCKVYNERHEWKRIPDICILCRCGSNWEWRGVCEENTKEGN